MSDHGGVTRIHNAHGGHTNVLNTYLYGMSGTQMMRYVYWLMTRRWPDHGGDLASMAGNAEARPPGAGAVPAASTDELRRQFWSSHRAALACIRVGLREREARRQSVSGRWEQPL